jgi:hypothetical protein
MQSVFELLEPLVNKLTLTSSIEQKLIDKYDQKLKHVLVDHAQGSTRQQTKNTLTLLTEQIDANAKDIYKSIKLTDKPKACLDQDIYALLASFNLNILRMN